MYCLVEVLKGRKKKQIIERRFQFNMKAKLRSNLFECFLHKADNHGEGALVNIYISIKSRFLNLFALKIFLIGENIMRNIFTDKNGILHIHRKSQKF